jgi:putative spermidine/putrescine transport system substrate-binding protein
MRRLLMLGLVAALVVPATGVGSRTAPPASIGAGEGELRLLAWEGYAEKQWVTPFERQTRCSVDVTYARSSDEMVDLLRRGRDRYDLVSASGDASLELIYHHDVQPVNVELVPGFENFSIALRSPPHNTVKGVHYGVSLLWGVNTLLYNAAKVQPALTSWSAIYQPRYRGKIAVPDNPLQIADAALYLSKSKPALGITDPYELTRPQFDATIRLLERQRPLVRSYWKLAADEIDLFKRGDVWLGPSWQLQKDRLAGEHVPVEDLIPKEGATGWADSWLISAKAKHPNCAYRWLRWTSTPLVQAELAVSFGATPANPRACVFMERLAKGSCRHYHADAPSAYSRSIRFWKTPIADCGNGRRNCVDYSKWVRAWKELRR